MAVTGTWTIIGSGGGEASADRASSGHLLETQSATVLFDCGDGVTRSFIRAGKSYESLDAICISHTHPDHICGLSFFLQQLYLVKRTRPLTLYLPGEAIESYKSYLRLQYLFLERFPFTITFEALAHRREIVIDDVHIRPQANDHLTKFLGEPWMAEDINRGECYSFLCEIDGKHVLYTADFAAVSDLPRIPGLLLLVVETTHLDPRDIAAYARELKTENVAVAHFGLDADPEGVTKAFADYPGHLILASDGESILL
jgi:ribonuclease BN (tRNA processing enzyme)